MKSDLVLVDTSLWIHFLRGSSAAVQSGLVPLIKADRVATADIVVMELLRGAKSQKHYDALQKDLAALHSLDISKKVWERAAKLAFALRNKGVNVPLTDTVIAAIAVEYGCLLLHDDRHYEMISEVTALRAERMG
jgi:predicted nucleic acid-binding protein